MRNCGTSLAGVKNDTFCYYESLGTLRVYLLTASLRTWAHINGQNRQLKAKMADTLNGTGQGLQWIRPRNRYWQKGPPNYLKEKRKSWWLDHALQKSVWVFSATVVAVPVPSVCGAEISVSFPLLMPGWACVWVLLPSGWLSWQQVVADKRWRMGQPDGFGVIQSRSKADLLGLSNPLRHVFALTVNYLQMVFYGSGALRNHVSSHRSHHRKEVPAQSLLSTALDLMHKCINSLAPWFIRHLERMMVRNGHQIYQGTNGPITVRWWSFVSRGAAQRPAELDPAPGPGWLWPGMSLGHSLLPWHTAGFFSAVIFNPHFLQIFTALIPN